MGHKPQPRKIDISGIVSGYVLRLARESIPRTQNGLAEDLEVDLATLQGWESGRRPLANVKAGALLDLRRRLPALGADSELVQLLDAAMDADRILSGALSPPLRLEQHPLGEWVHTRATAHMFAWAVNGTPPPMLANRPAPRRRGAVPTAPIIPVQQRLQLFTHLRDVAEGASSTSAAGVLLRRQAAYLTSYDDSPDTSAWTAHVLHKGRGALSVHGWSSLWPEARSTATALARQGDPQPLRDFIERALVDDDAGEAANLNYWAYWLGAASRPQPSDLFMRDRELTGWDPITLLRLLTRGLQEAPTYVELYAHSIWALVHAYPWLPQAAPSVARVLGERVGKILDHNMISPRSRRDLCAVQYQLGDRT
ncbi:XRE family transcriptional regulator [Streptomyces sp. YS-3]|uniref:XRE family transcriptional regulator n=1 Tax=Streptomyces sp. YS-3 TaxID=3381352 RepID=UPI0038624221